MNRNEKYSGDPQFTKRQIGKGTWYIKGSRGCDTYVLIGGDKAAVIDTGENRQDLRAFVETLTDRPLVVCNTHGHFDHTGANGQFKDYPVYMSSFAVNDCKLPHNYLDPGDFILDYTPRVLRDGEKIDLGGGRVIEAIALPCHSPGSLCFLDTADRMLFTGDEVETGQVLIQGDNRIMSSVERYHDNMLTLKKRFNDFDYICPGHNGSPAYKELIDDYIEAAECVLRGIEGKKDIGSPTWLSDSDPRTPTDKYAARHNPMFRRSEWKGASLVYSINRISYGDEIPLRD